jgi:glycosyltransferase involved in cell wall biosynthesis
MTAASPVVSVLIATHNQADYLPACLTSVRAQALPVDAYEIVVVDDGSTDATATVLAEEVASALTIVRHPQQRGLAAACNTALSRARGTFVVRLDSDDWFDQDALVRLLGATGKSSVDIVIPAYWIVDGDRLEVLRPHVENLFTWMAGGVLLRRSAVVRVGGYRNFFWEEYDLYLRLLSGGACVVTIDAPVLFHREHRLSMTADDGRRGQGWAQLKAAWPLETLRRFGFDRCPGAEQVDSSLA